MGPLVLSAAIYRMSAAVPIIAVILYCAGPGYVYGHDTLQLAKIDPHDVITEKKDVDLLPPIFDQPKEIEVLGENKAVEANTTLPAPSITTSTAESTTVPSVDPKNDDAESVEDKFLEADADDYKDIETSSIQPAGYIGPEFLHPTKNLKGVKAFSNLTDYFKHKTFKTRLVRRRKRNLPSYSSNTGWQQRNPSQSAANNIWQSSTAWQQPGQQPNSFYSNNNQQQHIVGSLGFQPSNACNMLCQDKIETFGHRIGVLESEVRRLAATVQRQEAQIGVAQVASRGCTLNGRHYSEGQSFSGDEACTECTCSNGDVSCRALGCKPLRCAHPVRVAGQCCPVCKQQCSYQGIVYSHGQSIRPKTCIICRCDDGNMNCVYESASDCKPIWNCPYERQVTPPNHCCPVCQGDDFCAKKPCHSNASCVNGQHDRECRCNRGFFGNGEDCFDINECDTTENAFSGGSQRCGLGTRCMNSVGNFTCECLAGFSRVDQRTCVNLLLF